MAGLLSRRLPGYCESVLVQVPGNTPQEDRWVDSEFEALSMTAGASGWQQRWNRVWDSLENARKSLTAFLSECSSLAGKLYGPQTRSPAAEALLWVQLSRLPLDGCADRARYHSPPQLNLVLMI